MASYEVTERVFAQDLLHVFFNGLTVGEALETITIDEDNNLKVDIENKYGNIKKVENSGLNSFVITYDKVISEQDDIEDNVLLVWRDDTGNLVSNITHGISINYFKNEMFKNDKEEPISLSILENGLPKVVWSVYEE